MGSTKQPKRTGRWQGHWHIDTQPRRCSHLSFWSFILILIVIVI